MSDIKQQIYTDQIAVENVPQGYVLSSNGTAAVWSATVGYSGSQGEIGYAGSKGDPGGFGYTGSLGPTGYTGSQGDIGYSGSAGFVGSAGYTGSQGEQGQFGYTGSQGPLGYTGSVGSQGEVGYTGSQGTAGTTGYTGSKGDLGYSGSIGFTGSAGAGYTGSKGDQGIPGEAAAIGYTGSVGIPTLLDEDWEYRYAVFDFEGTPGDIYAVERTESKPVPLTNNGQLSNTIVKTGNTSFYSGTDVSVSGKQKLSFYNTFGLGSGKFTVEGWFYFLSFNNSSFPGLWDSRLSGTDAAGIGIYLTSTTLVVRIGSTSNSYTLSTIGVSLNTWVHIALEKVGTTITLYIDGVSRGTITNTSQFTNTLMYIGSTFDGYAMSGYIDRFRVTVGKTVYGGAFTPSSDPFPISKYSVIGSTTGYTGSIGFTGSTGVGYTGSQGIIGYTGSKGDLGYTGSIGPAGAGYTGSAGATSTANATSQTFTASGSQTAFTLNAAIASQNNAIVSLDGLVQTPAIDYSISGTTLTFTSAPLANTLIEVRNLEQGAGGGSGGSGTANLGIQSFYAFYPGLNSAENGTLRRYFSTNINLNKITTWVTSAGSSYRIRLNKNGSEVANVLINTSSTIANTTFSNTVLADTDYLTVDIASGSGTDIGIRVDYTV